MRNDFVRVVALAAFATVGLLCDESMAGAIKGGVRDQGKKPPDNGLSGAKVQLRREGGSLTDAVITDADGQYEISNVDEGEYTLVVTKVGYIPRPLERTKVKVGPDATVDDVELMQENGNDAYYAVVAKAMMQRADSDRVRVKANAVSERDSALSYEWAYLQVIELPPSSKARIAVQLSKHDPEARDSVPDLAAYLASSPQQITEAEQLFSRAIEGKSEVPGKDRLESMKIHQEIVADIVAHQVRSTSAPEAQRKAFISEFLGKWEDTLAAKRFLTPRRTGRFYYSAPDPKK